MEWNWENFATQDPWKQSQQNSLARRREANRKRRQRRLTVCSIISVSMLAVAFGFSQADPGSAEESRPQPRPQQAAHSPNTLPSNTPYRELIYQASRETGVESALLAGLIQTESDFKPQTVSSAQALGLTQVLQENADQVGLPDLSHPRNQILAGARLLRGLLRQFGSTSLALAAYNAGPGAVQHYGGIPPYSETQNYVPRVLKYRKNYLPGGQGYLG